MDHHSPLSRRRFLATAAAGAFAFTRPAWAASIPVIDTHIHLFDPTRPQGVPWPPKTDPILYKPALPARYTKLVQDLGIVGAIEVEASPWLEDNQWVLDVARDNSIIVGTVGDLEPDKPDFPKQLERFHRNPLFRGIRYGNLWGRDLTAGLGNPLFLANLKLLAEADLEMDSANPNPALIRDLVRLTDKVPDLRIVIDHLPHLRIPTEASERNKYEADLHELGQKPQVFVKVSEVPQKVNGTVSFDIEHYRALLDHLWETFGEDRLLFGSDWPNSDPWGTYSQVITLVRSYFLQKGQAAAEKYFWKNSVKAYRWQPRNDSQPRTAAL